MVNFGQQTGHSGFAGTRIAHKHQMERHGGHRQAGLFPEFAHVHQIDQALHILLDPIQAAQAVQFRQQFFQRFLRLRRPFPFVRRGGGRDRRRKLVRTDSGTFDAQTVLVTQLQQTIAAGVDKARLALADHPVHRGEQEQEQGKLVGKASG